MGELAGVDAGVGTLPTEVSEHGVFASQQQDLGDSGRCGAFTAVYGFGSDG